MSHNLDGSKSRFNSDTALMSKIGINNLLHDTDLVVGRYTHALTRLGLVPSEAPLVLDVDDLGSEIYQSRLQDPTMKFFHKVIIKRHIKNIKKNEESVFNAINALWVCNISNKTVPGLSNAEYLPNIAFSNSSGDLNNEPIPAGNKNIIFVASYKHKPNSDGIYWFLDRVWNKVSKAVPDAKLILYALT